MENFADIVIFENKFIAMINGMCQADAAEEKINVCIDAMETIAGYMTNIAKCNSSQILNQSAGEDRDNGKAVHFMACANAMRLLNEIYAQKEGGILLDIDLRDVAAVESFAVRLFKYYWKRAMEQPANERGNGLTFDKAR